MSPLRTILLAVASVFTIVGAGLLALSFWAVHQGEDISVTWWSFDLRTALVGSLPYGIGAPTLGILLIKRAGQSRFTRFLGWLILLTAIPPLGFLGLILLGGLSG